MRKIALSTSHDAPQVGMMKDERLAPSHQGSVWTRAEDYLIALARRRSARHQRGPKPRTEPDEPRFMLSTLPFLLVLAALGVLAVAIMIIAWPGGEPRTKMRPAPPSELGTAPSGWFDKAKREFR